MAKVRTTVRLGDHDLALIGRAAARSNISPIEFIRGAALRQAKQEIGGSRSASLLYEPEKTPSKPAAAKS